MTAALRPLYALRSHSLHSVVHRVPAGARWPYAALCGVPAPNGWFAVHPWVLGQMQKHHRECRKCARRAGKDGADEQ